MKTSHFTIVAFWALIATTALTVAAHTGDGKSSPAGSSNVFDSRVSEKEAKNHGCPSCYDCPFCREKKLPSHLRKGLPWMSSIEKYSSELPGCECFKCQCWPCKCRLPMLSFDDDCSDLFKKRGGGSTEIVWSMSKYIRKLIKPTIPVPGIVPGVVPTLPLVISQAPLAIV